VQNCFQLFVLEQFGFSFALVSIDASMVSLVTFDV